MKFDYSLDYKNLDLRAHAELYRVGRGEQGVLMVEPYKSEIVKHWRFKTVHEAQISSRAIYRMFLKYKRQKDFVGMDMARKFLQMGFTRARRYANHPSGRKYGVDRQILPTHEDPVKAESARVFYAVWKRAEADATYASRKRDWKIRLG